jgi:hypothetical protein
MDNSNRKGGRMSRERNRRRGKSQEPPILRSSKRTGCVSRTRQEEMMAAEQNKPANKNGENNYIII